MKKLLAVCLLITPSFLFGGSCCGGNNADKKNATETMRNKVTNRQKTVSGLEYVVEKEGSGEMPKKGQQVTVHYTGWLDNNGQPGLKFDSSVDRNKPFTFVLGVGRVIKGWDEGVMSMKVGEKRRLYVPAKLGYGSEGAGRSIPPHAALIFDVELLKVD